MAKKHTKAEVRKKLGKLSVCYLATCDRGQPRVRPMALIHKDGKLWMATDAKSAKAKQMGHNPRVEICVPLVRGKHSGYVQITARAKEVRTVRERREIGKYSRFIDQYWEMGVDDPGFALYGFRPTMVRYMRPGEMDAVKVKW